MTVPAGLNAGDSFKQHGRHYVVIKLDDTDSLAGVDQLIAVEAVHSYPTSQFEKHPMNRKWFSEEKKKEMLDSLRQSGQTTPGIARRLPNGKLQLIAGERRWSGCEELGMPLQVMVREYSDVEAAEILLIENAKREDLRPVDEAEIYDAMLQLRDEAGHRLFTLEKIAQRVHGEASKSTMMKVAKIHKLLQLPKEAARALNEGVITVKVAVQVARMANPKDREEAGKRVVKHKYYGRPMTAEETELMIREEFQVNLKGKGPEFMDSNELLTDDQKAKLGFTGADGEAADGSCARCPHLAKNNPAFATQLAGKTRADAAESGIDPNTCTNAACHAMKCENLWERSAAAMQAKHPEAKILPATACEKLGGWNCPYAELNSAPEGNDTGDYQQKAPKWSKLLKDCEVPLLIGQKDGAPVLVVKRELAVAAARKAHPDVFKKARTNNAETKAMKPDERKKHEESEKRRREKEALEKKIADEVKRDSLKELYDRILSKGLGIEGRKILALSITRETSIEGPLGVIQGKKVESMSHKQEEAAIEKLLAGATQDAVDGFIVMATMFDDVMWSGVEKASEFKSLCACVRVDLKAVEKRIRDAYKLAEQQRAKVEAEKEKKAQKKPTKNSVDPTNVSTAKVNATSKAGDERHKEKSGPSAAEKVTGIQATKLGKATGWTPADVEAGAKLLKAKSHDITTLIGPKPDAKKDAIKYKNWNGLRMKLLRKAGLAK